MFFQQKKRLDRIEKMLNEFMTSQYTALGVMQRENERLIADNKELRDRIMAVDYAKFQVYARSTLEGPIDRPLAFDYDEDNAGEIVEETSEDVGRAD